MENRPQLHVSMLDMISKCGIQFQRRYGHRFGCWHEEEKRLPGIGAVIGTTVHATIERDLGEYLLSGELLPDDAVTDYGRTVFEKQWDEGVDPKGEDEKKVKAEGVDKTVALTTLHHTITAPLLKPMAIEKPFVLELKGYPYDLAGKMDIVEDGIIRDTKTGKMPPEIQSTQMAMYSLAHKVETGVLPKFVAIDHLVSLKTVPKKKDPGRYARVDWISCGDGFAEWREIVKEPRDAWIQPLYRKIEDAIKLIESVKKGYLNFPSADGNSWICTAKWCGWAKECQYWLGRME